MATTPEENEALPDGWSDLTEEEREELRRDFARAEEELRRGETIPIDEILPRYRQVG